eukprot:scaffold25039_cov69-Phaeocystis_antarctica.AAC.6
MYHVRRPLPDLYLTMPCPHPPVSVRRCRSFKSPQTTTRAPRLAVWRRFWRRRVVDAASGERRRKGPSSRPVPGQRAPDRGAAAKGHELPPGWHHPRPPKSDMQGAVQRRHGEADAGDGDVQGDAFGVLRRDQDLQRAALQGRVRRRQRGRAARGRPGLLPEQPHWRGADRPDGRARRAGARALRQVAPAAQPRARLRRAGLPARLRLGAARRRAAEATRGRGPDGGGGRRPESGVEHARGHERGAAAHRAHLPRRGRQVHAVEARRLLPSALRGHQGV